MLQRQGRVSYRALKRQFDLDDAYIDDLKFEIIEVHRAADGTTVASQAISDGQFRIRLKPGSYDVASVPPTPTSARTRSSST